MSDFIEAPLSSLRDHSLTIDALQLSFQKETPQLLNANSPNYFATSPRKSKTKLIGDIDHVKHDDIHNLFKNQIHFLKSQKKRHSPKKPQITSSIVVDGEDPKQQGSLLHDYENSLKTMIISQKEGLSKKKKSPKKKMICRQPKRLTPLSSKRVSKTSAMYKRPIIKNNFMEKPNPHQFSSRASSSRISSPCSTARHALPDHPRTILNAILNDRAYCKAYPLESANPEKLIRVISKSDYISLLQQIHAHVKQTWLHRYQKANPATDTPIFRVNQFFRDLSRIERQCAIMRLEFPQNLLANPKDGRDLLSPALYYLRVFTEYCYDPFVRDDVEKYIGNQFGYKTVNPNLKNMLSRISSLVAMQRFVHGHHSSFNRCIDMYQESLLDHYAKKRLLQLHAQESPFAFGESRVKHTFHENYHYHGLPKKRKKRKKKKKRSVLVDHDDGFISPATPFSAPLGNSMSQRSATPLSPPTSFQKLQIYHHQKSPSPPPPITSSVVKHLSSTLNQLESPLLMDTSPFAPSSNPFDGSSTNQSPPPSYASPKYHDVSQLPHIHSR